MSKPLITFAVSDDGNSIFVYRGGEAVPEGSQLEACVGLQGEVRLTLEQLLEAALEDDAAESVGL